MKRRTPSTLALMSANISDSTQQTNQTGSTGSVSSVGLPIANTKLSVPPPSLYQQCLTLTDRLMCVPGFDQYLDPKYNTDVDTSPDGTFSRGSDPVRVLWTTLRNGAPLCALFNALRPKVPLEVKTEFRDLSNTNSCKASVYHFILACKKELQFKEDQLFTITELYQDDTNGFVKVIKTVSEVLDRIEKLGLMTKPRRPSLRYSDPDRLSDAPIGNREKVVSELLETERKYVADLEILQNYMRKLQQADIVSLETIRNLFANLHSLVDFQRRFLIGVETNAQLQPNDQRFGALFVQMEENFGVYEPFCANYSSASQLAVQETPNLMKLSHVLEPCYALPALLIKPIQRICKYPLLLNELIRHTEPTSYKFYDELLAGREAIKRVTDKVNEERRREENLAMVNELAQRVEDWKGHSIDSFGALLLSDKFVMATNDVERELHVFLFEKILLCCKESGSNKKRSGGAAQFAMMMRSTKGGNSKRPGLQLKGRIFITSVTGVINNSKNGQYALKVFWRDVEMESFSLRCRNEEQLKLWKSTLAKLVEDANREKEALSANSLATLEGNRSQRSTNSAPNLDSNAVAASVAQRGMLPDRPLPRRALTAGPGTYQSIPSLVMKAGNSSRDNDAISFINASDDDEDNEDDGILDDQSWDTRGRNPRGSNGQTNMQTKGRLLPDRSALDNWQRDDEGTSLDPHTLTTFQSSNLPTYPSNLPGMSFPPLPRSNSTSSIPGHGNNSYTDYNSLYPNSPPPSIPTSPSNGRVPNTSYQQPEEATSPSQLADTIARFMKITADGGSNRSPVSNPPSGSPPPPPRRIQQSFSTGFGVQYAQTETLPNPPPLLPPPKCPPGSLAAFQNRSASSPNLPIPTSYSETDAAAPVPPFLANGVPLPSAGRTDDGGILRRNVPSGPPPPPPTASSHRNLSTSSGMNNQLGMQSNYNQISQLQQRTSPAGTRKAPSPPSASTISPATSAPGALQPTNLKVKVSFLDDMFVIVVPLDIGYRDLMDRVEKKIRLCGGTKKAGVERLRADSPPLRVRYHDEDGDFITINSDDDVAMAFESKLAQGNVVNLFVS